MNNWKEATLDKVIELIIDHRGLTPKKLGGDWSDLGYRAISAKTIKNGQLVNEDQMNILPENLYKKWMKEETQYGDIFLTSEAPLGEHIIWKSKEKLVLSQRIFGIRTKKEILDPFFFNYFIDSKYYQHQLKSRESGSTVSGIKQSELLKTKVLFPSLSEQKEIVATLSSIDEKIELLRKQNETLEKIAQGIFKEWFVDFTLPAEVLTKVGIDGKKLKLENGIPEGWRVGKLTDIANFLNGYAMQKFPAENKNDYLPVIKIKEMNSGITDQTDKASKNIPEKYIVNNGDILFSWSGSLDINIWKYGKGALNQHLFKVTSEEYPKWFYFYWIKYHLPNFRQVANAKAVTMGHIQRHHLDDVQVVIPNVENLKKSNAIIEPIFEKTILNNSQIQTLSNLRNMLLPKLMSGKFKLEK
ncbi:MAG: Type I restriction-modification system, S subunit [Candidatus Moranbacteria bacterium GW2011_GWC2_37_8]|nr:MAG: Type I restriction-modification system, S subunit [Candidatus Moranbacteria bacterium GW2011_GWC2_37_8]KKQ62627.1 MAG: EcoKI restriction-modification system protein HsdS [Parcubacteria group bacterium GW2011_GWC1_38_22]